MNKTAAISPCEKHRYSLGRLELAPDGVRFAYFGINPSTADAERDDQTVKKLKVFTVRNGGKEFELANIFSYRATDVRTLRHVRPDDLRGPDFWHWVDKIIRQADVLVPCWGAQTKIPRQYRHMIDDLSLRLERSGKPVKCFGVTSDGSPKHPQMLAYATPLQDWIL